MAAPIFLDRRLTEGSTGVTAVFNGTITTFELPYGVEDGEGTVVIVRDSPRTLLGVTKVNATTYTVVGNFVGVPVHIGVVYDTQWEFSVIYRRDEQTGAPNIGDRLNIRYVKIHYEDAVAFTVSVTSADRPARTYEFLADDIDVPETGEFHVPVLSRNTETSITITSSSIHATNFSGYEWEGTFFKRIANRR